MMRRTGSRPGAYQKPGLMMIIYVVKTHFVNSHRLENVCYGVPCIPCAAHMLIGLMDYKGIVQINVKLSCSGVLKMMRINVSGGLTC